MSWLRLAEGSKDVKALVTTKMKLGFNKN